MESQCSGDLDTKPSTLSTEIWTHSNDHIRQNNLPVQEAINNAQLLLIAVEYVNDENGAYKYINDGNGSYKYLNSEEPATYSTLFTTNQIDLNDSTVATCTTDDRGATFNQQDSVVILPPNNGNQSLSDVSNSFDLHSVQDEENISLACPINSSVDVSENTAEKSFNGILNTLSSTNCSHVLGTNLGNDVGNNEQNHHRLVLDSNNLIALVDDNETETTTLVLKSDDLSQIDLNVLESRPSSNNDDDQCLKMETMEYDTFTTADTDVEENLDQVNIEEDVIGSNRMKLELHDDIVDDGDVKKQLFSALDIDETNFDQIRKSKRQLCNNKSFDNDKDRDQEDGEMFGNCDDCIVGVSDVIVCDRHKMLSISDKPVPSRARATLPVNYLSINKVTSQSNVQDNNIVYGVFARKFIPKRSQFGPIEGVILNHEDMDFTFFNNIELSLENEDGKMLKMDTSNENLSNWMRFVRKATKFEQQNLILNQMGPSLYYISTCNIYPRQELMVGYSCTYAKSRNLLVLTQESLSKSIEWPCLLCDQVFQCSQEWKQHITEHDKEDENNEKKQKIKKHKKKINQEKKSVMLTNNNDPLDLNANTAMVSSTENDPLAEKENQQEKIFYTCKTCKKNFELAILLEIHSYCHMNGNKEYLIDGKVVSSSTDEQYICPECDAQFLTKYLLATHVNEHQIIIKKNNCHKCHKSFPSIESLQKHVLSHGKKALQCEICLRRFSSLSTLSCHVKIHNLNRTLVNNKNKNHDKIAFECPICKEISHQVVQHKKHVKMHAVNGIYTCPYCKKEFKEYSIIRKHIRAFHGDRKHPCMYCAKLFPTIDKLRMHLLKHSDHREFLCAICGKQFKRKDKLKEHTKCLHSANSNKAVSNKTQKIADDREKSKRFKPKVSPTDYHRFIYKCHNCLVGFKRRGMLVNHLAKRHPDIPPDSVPELNLPILRTTRDYYCQYCDKVYKSSSKRKAHIIKNHPGYALPASNRNKEISGDLSGMLNPTYSQTVGSVTTNPHNCEWCHKQYASKAKLLQHQRSKHTEMLSSTPSRPTEFEKVFLSSEAQVKDALGVVTTTTSNGNALECNANNVKKKSIIEKIDAVKNTEGNERNEEFLNTDGFDSTILIQSSKKNEDEEQYGNDVQEAEYRLGPNGQYYRLIPIANDQDQSINVGDSVLRALLSSSVSTNNNTNSDTSPPIVRVWNDQPSFVSYVPPR